MSGVEFQKSQQFASFHNPLYGGELTDYELEVRYDPLTGDQSVFNPGLEGKANMLYPDTDFEYMQERAEESKSSCFLCPDNWRDNVPSFPREMVPEGVLERNRACIFPNLFPLGANHAVVRLGDEHLRYLNQLPADLLQEGMQVSLDYINKCYEYNSDLRYCTINANYLFPAGASVMHPHFQIMALPEASSHHKRLLDESRQFYQQTGNCYWKELLSREKELDERWIGSTGTCEWVASYSPGGFNEIMAVWPEKESFLQWEEEDVSSLARGLEKVLQLYHKLNLSTFNFTCYSAPMGIQSPEFKCVFRIVNRQNVVRHHRTDDFFVQKMLGNEIILNRPETLAGWLKEEFAKM